MPTKIHTRVTGVPVTVQHPHIKGILDSTLRAVGWKGSKVVVSVVDADWTLAPASNSGYWAVHESGEATRHHVPADMFPRDPEEVAARKPNATTLVMTYSQGRAHMYILAPSADYHEVMTVALDAALEIAEKVPGASKRCADTLRPLGWASGILSAVILSWAKERILDQPVE